MSLTSAADFVAVWGGEALNWGKRNSPLEETQRAIGGDKQQLLGEKERRLFVTVVVAIKIKKVYPNKAWIKKTNWENGSIIEKKCIVGLT